MLRHEMDAQAQAILAQASTVAAAALAAVPVMDASAHADAFLASVNRIGPYDSYDVMPERARAVVARITVAAGPTAVAAFLRHVLTRAVADTLQSARFQALPPTVRAQQTVQLARIAADTDVAAEWLDLDRDLFHKELGLASLRLYAAGAQLIDYHCGVPRSLLWRGGLAQAPRVAAALLHAGGVRPYFQIHTHEFMLDTFNPAGWNLCYVCCAELYSVHPEVRGMFGSSWFYDPQLDRVSPRLAYLRQVPVEGGAHLFLWERGGAALGNALSTSPTRRKLHEEGSYLPASYMMMWPRRAQLAWAARHGAAQGA